MLLLVIRRERSSIQTNFKVFEGSPGEDQRVKVEELANDNVSYIM